MRLEGKAVLQCIRIYIFMRREYFDELSSLVTELLQRYARVRQISKSNIEMKIREFMERFASFKIGFLVEISIFFQLHPLQMSIIQAVSKK